MKTNELMNFFPLELLSFENKEPGKNSVNFDAREPSNRQQDESKFSTGQTRKQGCLPRGRDDGEDSTHSSSEFVGEERIAKDNETYGANFKFTCDLCSRDFEETNYDFSFRRPRSEGHESKFSSTELTPPGPGARFISETRSPVQDGTRFFPEPSPPGGTTSRFISELSERDGTRFTYESLEELSMIRYPLLGLGK
jgi:hypothetical protein